MTSGSSTSTLDAVLRIARRQWWVVCLAAVAVAGLVLVASLVLDERYRATAVVIHRAGTYDLGAMGVGLSGDSRTVVARDALEVTTLRVAEQVDEYVGADGDPEDLLRDVDVSANQATESIEVTAEAASADQAAALANAFADTFVEQRRDEVRVTLEDAREEITRRLDALSPAELDSDYGASLQARQNELDLMLAVVESDYEVVEPALVPATPYFPRPVLFTVLGLVVGLLGGAGLAWLRDVRDRSLQDDSTVEENLGLEVLAAVPRLSSGLSLGGNGARHVGFGKQGVELFEAYRMLRSKVFLRNRSRETRIIAITSSRPQEGKTTTSINLAVAMALSGQSVAILEADLRRPAVANYLGLEPGPGLYEVLTGVSTLEDALRTVSLEGLLPEAADDFFGGRGAHAATPEVQASMAHRLRVVAAGNPGPDASELLEGNAFGAAARTLASQADYVLIDTPPVLAVHDVLTVLRDVQAVILTTRLGKTPEDDAQRAAELLRRAEAPMLGVVTIGARAGGKYTYYSYRQSGPSEAGGSS